MKITDATIDDVQMLAACVAACRASAEQELRTMQQLHGGNPANVERGKQLAAFLVFADRFLNAAQHAKPQFSPLKVS